MRPTNPVTEERWEALRNPERYTWFAQEQADVTAYVEQLRRELEQVKAERDELDKKLTVAQALLDGAYV